MSNAGKSNPDDSGGAESVIDDDALFREAMGDVQPLSSAKVSDQAGAERVDPTAGQLQRQKDAVTQRDAEGDERILTLGEVPTVDPQAVLAWKQDGVQQGVFTLHYRYTRCILENNRDGSKKKNTSAVRSGERLEISIPFPHKHVPRWPHPIQLVPFNPWTTASRGDIVPESKRRPEECPAWNFPRNSSLQV